MKRYAAELAACTPAGFHRYDDTAPEPGVPESAGPLSPAPALDSWLRTRMWIRSVHGISSGIRQETSINRRIISSHSPQFVKENPEHIEAIRILLDRPKDWGTDALSELKKKLAATTVPVYR